MKEVKIVEKPLYGAGQICLIMKFSPNTVDYVHHKYREKMLTVDDWKINFKKDGLDF